MLEICTVEITFCIGIGLIENGSPEKGPVEITWTEIRPERCSIERLVRHQLDTSTNRFWKTGIDRLDRERFGRA